MPIEHNRVELDPDQPAKRPDGPANGDAPALVRADSAEIAAGVDRLIASVGGDPSDTRGRLVRELLVTALKLIPDDRDTGELKLITTAVKELRYAYRVFGEYPDPHKVTIFGSARTPPDHHDYAAARDLGRLMAAMGWMVITGAGDGIMRAGHEGPGRQASFGAAIRLPFETTANEVIAGDEKLIHFRYFFTRKLMFISQAEAVVLFPGGFGTMDEGFEVLTLVQTGKASMIPIVLCEGAGGSYWREWASWVSSGLLDRRLISPEDTSLFYTAATPADAADHIARFYRVYHSSRYVRDDLVIRLRRPLTAEAVDRLNDEFAVLVKRGRIDQRGPYEAEDDHLSLPRLAFTHTRHRYGLVRRLIDRVNELGPGQDPEPGA